MVLMTLIVGSVMVNREARNKWMLLARGRAKVVVANTTTPDGTASRLGSGIRALDALAMSLGCLRLGSRRLQTPGLTIP
jgi:hypothetical protein